MAGNRFRDLLYPLDSPRLTAHRGLDANAYGKAILEFPPAAQLINWWRELADQPYRGVSIDGNPRQGLFPLAAEGAPTRSMVVAARQLLSRLSDGERAKLQYPIDAPQWRLWSNPEFLMSPFGLRLEELSDGARNAILGIVRASMSPAGFEKARGCMRINAFLGVLCDMPTILNEWSYNFLLFGEPSETGPWGWNLYGHHLALNCFVLDGQMVISPTFMGAEPNRIDTGPHAGLELFRDEEADGLEIMRSLPDAQRDRARIYRGLHDPAMPEGRWNPADQRHLGGAFQDNRVIPLEGVPARDFTPGQRDRLMGLIAAFVGYLPPGPLAARLRQIEAHLDDTWWSWIGGWGDDDPFYYRVQSPVVMVEFDHHSGVWLANDEPAKCHIHTVVRTPNGNDYGKDLLRQHYEQVHPGRKPGSE